jgi:hypothetical protein
MEAALTILTTMGIGGVMGFLTRLLLNYGPRIVAAATENPWLWTGIVLPLCGAVSYLGKLLLERSDKAHAAELAGKDALITQWRERYEEEAAGRKRYEDKTMLLLETTQQAAAIATQAVVANRGGA